MICIQYNFRYAPEKPEQTLGGLASKSLITLVNSDNVLDYPRVGMPHVVNVGGITTKPSASLPDDIQTFINNATDGIIVVSFGSVASSIPVDLVQTLANALKRRPEKVILKFTKLDHVPVNMLMLPWIPQNDILGQDNVKLFITHGGNNGQFEALYHGVPMLVLPVFAEQPANARRVKYRGYGEYLSLIDLEEEELLQTIDQIIRTPSYKRNIQKASRIFRSSPMTPVERSAYWIEHVLEFGGDHLHSIALDMPWYRYLMLDVLIVLLLGMAASTLAVYYAGIYVSHILQIH